MPPVGAGAEPAGRPGGGAKVPLWGEDCGPAVGKIIEVLGDVPAPGRGVEDAWPAKADALPSSSIVAMRCTYLWSMQFSVDARCDSLGGSPGPYRWLWI